MKRDIWQIPVRGCVVAFSSKLEDIAIETRIVEESASPPSSSNNPTFSLYTLDSRSTQTIHPREFNELILASQFESFGIQLSPDAQLAELCQMSVQLRSSPEEFDGKFTNTCLNSFKENMVIQVNYGMMDTPQGMTSKSNPEDIPRHKRAYNTVFPWRKTKQQQERMTTVTILEVQKYLVHLIHAHSVRVEQYK
ncbi:hypothetical protein RSOLAG22IIIB_09623 [Rhizoctonia solani]|uniref:Uncharacterized protein n=1 Tax=Rhizoctonia solani TaxID=456999 RepID=A0A0K6FYZ9_9AGAM|nr:hypothetical protein RSOLAG22IIIB_09623 [Rhizoctonia solani]